MGAIKTGAYSSIQETLALLAKALGHPARISIVQELASQQSCQCGELAERIGLAQSTVSQHLKELKNAGIIKGSIEDSKPCYCLSAESLKSLQDFLSMVSQPDIADLKSCC